MKIKRCIVFLLPLLLLSTAFSMLALSTNTPDEKNQAAAAYPICVHCGREIHNKVFYCSKCKGPVSEDHQRCTGRYDR